MSQANDPHKSKRGKMIAGERNHRLVAVQFVDRDKHSNSTWLFRCDCGQEITAVAGNVRAGRIKSCGCLNQELVAARNETHGQTGTPEYVAWQSMRARCADQENPLYGGRGIKVCDRWLNSFENFLADMGHKPSPEHSLDRYPNGDGNYEPTNCRWATNAEQSRHRRSNHRVTYLGREMLLVEAAELAGVDYDVACRRLNDGWPIEKALSKRDFRRK